MLVRLGDSAGTAGESYGKGPCRGKDMRNIDGSRLNKVEGGRGMSES